MLARTEWLAEPSLQAVRHGFARRAIGLLRAWRNRIMERDGLAALNERDLRDARLSRADVFAEIAKPFWRA